MQANSLQNKTAVVTGAGQGIGFQICLSLARRGVKVVLNDIDKTLAEKAATAIRKEGGICIAVAGDASSMDFVKSLIAATILNFGQLDIAIANAGITLFGNFRTYRPDALAQVLNVNIVGTFFLAQAAANQMIEQRSGGSLLFTSSVTGHQAHKNLAAYSMTKAALEMLAKNLVIELSPYQININAVAPGATVTERTIDDPTYEATWSRITPMGRPATTSDIAHAALFLVSDEARHITGQTIIIDGGWTSTSPSPF